MASRFLELHGDRWSGDDPAIIGGIAELNGDTVVMIGQERGGTPEEKAASHDGKAYSEGYRKSLRLMRLASKFKIPVITLVDCPNAQANYESEHRGIAFRSGAQSRHDGQSAHADRFRDYRGGRQRRRVGHGRCRPRFDARKRDLFRDFAGRGRGDSLSRCRARPRRFRTS